MASMKSAFSSKHYDERQLFIRYRIAFETLMILSALVFVNGLFKMFYGIWAESMVETIIVLFLPLMYFISKSIWNDAYFSKTENHKFILILSGIAGLLWLFIFMLDFSMTDSIIKNGVLSSDLDGLIFGIFWLFVPVVYFMKLKFKKNEEEADE